MKYLWTNRDIKVGDLCLLVYGAEDISGQHRIPDMKLIPVKISSYDEEKNEVYIDLYTIREKRFVRMEVGKDKINCLIANTASGVLGRLIPYNWNEEINNNYK